jgi:Bacterial TSP3 repeat
MGAMTRPPRVGARHTVLVAMVAALVIGALPAAAAASSTDPDKDGLPTAWEIKWSHTNPRKADSNGNGIPDGKEDPDKDTLNNRQEYLAGMKPRRADSDGDGIRDDKEDTDKDGLKTKFEFTAGTKPKVKDTDRDGLRDDREDPDKDGLTNRQEQARGTHPRKKDTDGDGYADGTEVKAGTNPLDRTSHPTLPSTPPPPSGGSAGAPTLPGIPDCSVFPADNVWNARIDGLGVASNSSTMISSIGLNAGLHMDFGSYTGYGIPYNVVTSTTLRSAVTFDYDEDSDHVLYPIPASPKIEGGGSAGSGDRHILMVDRDACRLFELFNARLVSGSWRAGSGATWDMRSNALRTVGWTSADAAGLPILPGLVRYDEVAAGAINHALRFTTAQTRKLYIYPARHYASDSTSASLPPMGLRVRLAASYDTSGFSPQARVIAEALKRYGMILADNGSPWYITGVSDPQFDDDVMHELDVITGHDLQVVDTSGLVNGP